MIWAIPFHSPWVPFESANTDVLCGLFLLSPFLQNRFLLHTCTLFHAIFDHLVRCYVYSKSACRMLRHNISYLQVTYAG